LADPFLGVFTKELSLPEADGSKRISRQAVGRIYSEHPSSQLFGNESCIGHKNALTDTLSPR
jgi:hypothetical protein